MRVYERGAGLTEACGTGACAAAAAAHEWALSASARDDRAHAGRSRSRSPSGDPVLLDRRPSPSVATIDTADGH